MEETSLKGAVSKVLQRLFPFHQSSVEKTFTLAEVSTHCHYNDCWIVVGDNVYDVTAFLDKHPGGYDVLMEHAGRDATVAFYGAGHHISTINLLEPLCVGSLVQNERINIMRTVSSTERRWTRETVAVME